MAERPPAPVRFDVEGCPDCGARVAAIPPALPPVPDDIDLRARDYDDLRRVMLEDLAARQPSRTTWSPADEEVVLVEAIATMLDELSDMADRTVAESYLDTARRPASVRWLLGLIGVPAAREALAAGALGITEAEVARRSTALHVDEDVILDVHLDRYWFQHPEAMDAARAAGPGRIREQLRMVTVSDAAERLEDHPLVARAAARFRWHGSWPRIIVALVLNERGGTLDRVSLPGAHQQREIAAYHERFGLPEPDWALSGITARGILRPYVEHLRQVGTEVVLDDVVEVPVMVALSIEVATAYWRTEVVEAVRSCLGSGPHGFFRPGRFAIGEDLHTSDLLEEVATIDGVASICVNRFKRRGDRFPDRTADGFIPIDDLEVPTLGPGDSGLRLTTHGGRVG